MTRTASARLLERLQGVLGPDRVHSEEAIGPLTTFRIGGPAECLASVQTIEEIELVTAAARDSEVPWSVLGGGSNLLVADEGIRGLVIRVRGGTIREIGAGRIRADAGVTINGLVRWTISHGLAGLEAWAGTPGTVGGAVYGNAHFQGRNIGDRIAAVTVLTTSGQVLQIANRDMAFAYDFSRIQRTREIVLAAEFHVEPGDPERLRPVARESLAYRKRTQPLALASAGCIFQNPERVRDRVPADVPCSAGALVDRAGLKGVRQGQARVSPVHANFIVNEGAATAADVAVLVERCRAAVRDRFGIELRDEIVRLGFGAPPGEAG